MPTIDVKGHLIDFPDNLSPDELNKAVGSAAEQLTNIGGDTTAPPEGEKGLIRKGWDALAIPEKKSREGLRMLADFVPNPEPRTGRIYFKGSSGGYTTDRYYPAGDHGRFGPWDASNNGGHVC